MNWIAPLWREWQVFYYVTALRHINPLHSDVPHIVRKLNELRSERPA